MKLLNKLLKILLSLSVKKKIALVIVITVLGFLVYSKQTSSSNKTQYQTATVSKGTLVVSLTESGSVLVSNKVSVVTQASGIVSNVYVKPGDSVNQGDKIADVTLDTAGQQKQAQAYTSLISAQNNLNSANAQLYTLQNNLFVANQKFVNDRGIANPTDQQKSDPVYIEENANWLAAEAAYKNQTNVIAQAQANVNNTSLTYQLTSGTITAPTSGTIGDLIITKGMQIGSSNTNSGSSTNTSNQTIASIVTGSATAISVNVSEVDAPQVKVGQRATVTFDALTNKTFTGKVVGMDTTGSVSSGVVTYPAVIVLDETSKDILPNMSATASIITKIVDSVLLIPSSAVQTVGADSTVRVFDKGQLKTVSVSTGDSSDSQTVITSGLSEGQTIVTSAVSATTTTSSSSSPFSGGLRFGTFGGGPSGGGGNTVRRVGN